MKIAEHEYDSLLSYFTKRVRKTSGCWVWKAGKNKFGYGRARFRGKRHGAHRIAWLLYKGEIPRDMWVLHKCDNTSCVNPDHLFLGTPKDNTHDMMKKGRDAFTGEKQWQSKLTIKEVIYIKENYFKAENKREFAKKMGISPSHCCGIAYGNFWKHLQNLKRPQ